MAPAPTEGHARPDEQDAGLRIEDAVNPLCPWSGKPIAADALTLYNGAVVGFCNPDCRDKFALAVAGFEDALRARRLVRSDVHQ